MSTPFETPANLDPLPELSDGTPVRMGLVQPEVLRFGAVPAWADRNPVLPESQWEEHDDYAPHCRPSLAQSFNNCTNASLAWLLAAAFRVAGLDCPPLSRSYLYAFHNGGRDEGAMCRDLAASCMSRGLPPESEWPESKIYLSRGGVPAAVDALAKQHLALEIYQCLNWADVGSALTNRFLVYHGFVLGQAFFNTGKDGIVPPWDGRLANGHAMGSRGLRKVNGQWRTITPNTWGPSFGDNGVGYIDASYFWPQRGNFVNLDAYAIRAVKASKSTTDSLPDGMDA